jgi:polyhydroxyalkanoate synthase
MANPEELLAEMARWTGVVGRMQQLMLEAGHDTALKLADEASAAAAQSPALADPAAWWKEAVSAWSAMLPAADATPSKDRRFRGARWQEPLFATIRQSYLAISERLLANVDALEGFEPKQKEQLRFLTQNFVDAMSPANFALTNPEVMARTLETGGQNLVTGLERMLADIGRGQIRHVGEGAFEVGTHLATTPGKVVKETPLYQLIHYAPVTEAVQATPILIFPPWINRFYILDLTPEKSFVRWAVENGLSVFMVSWKSADASLADMTMDDYVLKGELDAIDTVRDLLDVSSVHVVGYCVAGTALSMLLAWLATRGEADKVASATFFTTQVDFAEAGELSLFVDDAQLRMFEALGTDGALDGRYMAATFNLLRSRDLIWNYVVNNYLLGEDYAPFDLLHWNGDVTNLPSKWHGAYLSDFYRDNRLAKGEMTVAGVPIDLSRIETPTYAQAGREDHIAPAASVWKLTHHFRGPLRFVLAGSGHIAGVVNPPAAGKYQYWTNEGAPTTLDEFVAGATEHKGSWWPDWLRWLGDRSAGEVPAKGARIPGEGKLPGLEDAPGRYVRMR